MQRKESKLMKMSSQSNIWSETDRRKTGLNYQSIVAKRKWNNNDKRKYGILPLYGINPQLTVLFLIIDIEINSFIN